MSDICVYCGCSDKLNTAMTLSFDDGVKVAVKICDAHAEDASVKTAKQKFLERKAQIDEFLAKAKELGLDVQINTQSGKLAVATVAQTPVVEPLKTNILVPELELEPISNRGMVVDSEAFDRRSRLVQSGGGDGGAFGPVEDHGSHDIKRLKNKLAEDATKGKVVVEPVECRDGQMLLLPTRRTDGMGTTTISVTKMTDAELQRRTKDISQDISRDRHPGYGKHGKYDEPRRCPVCNGEGKATIKRGQKAICPKCGGSGEIA